MFKSKHNWYTNRKERYGRASQRYRYVIGWEAPHISKTQWISSRVAGYTSDLDQVDRKQSEADMVANKAGEVAADENDVLTI
ncbi:MAG: hypothetical protein M1822_005654 [Bathelium mastoideum]|nr:MAG: hypothetical protein M1822_005654 [Bathelium mastoideum]